MNKEYWGFLITFGTKLAVNILYRSEIGFIDKQRTGERSYRWLSAVVGCSETVGCEASRACEMQS